MAVVNAGNLNAASKPLMLKGTVRKPFEDKAGVSLLGPLDVDTFESAAQKTKTGSDAVKVPSAADETSKKLSAALQQGNWLERKAKTAYLLKQAAGIDHTKGLLQTLTLDQTQKEEITQLAEKIQEASSERKVKLLADITGTDSVYTRYAKAKLLGTGSFGVLETVELFKPKVVEKSLSGYMAAFSTVGVGLLLLSIITPATLLFNMAGQYIAGLALLLA